MCICVGNATGHMLRAQATPWGSQFFPPTVWVPGTELRLSGLAVCTPAYGVITLAVLSVFSQAAKFKFELAGRSSGSAVESTCSCRPGFDSQGPHKVAHQYP